MIVVCLHPFVVIAKLSTSTNTGIEATDICGGMH